MAGDRNMQNFDWMKSAATNVAAVLRVAEDRNADIRTRNDLALDVATVLRDG